MSAALSYKQSHPTATLKDLKQTAARKVYRLEHILRRRTDYAAAVPEADIDPLDPNADTVLDFGNSQPSYDVEDQWIEKIDRDRLIVKLHKLLSKEDFAFYCTYTECDRPHTAQERKRMERLRDVVKDVTKSL